MDYLQIDIMEILGYILLGTYVISLIFITIYCFFQFHLLVNYLKSPRNVDDDFLDQSEAFPFVTIQLPIFNEYYVVDRLIDNIVQLEYPQDRFEIQVLDDSTDETVERSRAKVEEYKAKGFDISLLTREDRVGYKAGALKAAMSKVKGEFIAIFDADFLPEKDFLLKTIPHFKDSSIGVVQTRWGHINQAYSILTELQAFQLNVHFTVEQKGREKGDFLLQFNGTAGVWRTKTIEEAGGWEADTLTEDLDLSYRAQLCGWRIVFLEDITAPAELPAEMIGLKSQQHRWMKGGAETARKLLPKIWASDLRFLKKLHASMHLLGSSIFLFVFLVGVLSVPLVFVFTPAKSDLAYLSFSLLATLSILIIYYVANVKKAWDQTNKLKSILKFIFIFPTFLALSMGLSFHNSLAVIQGYLGKQTPFKRTPKFNIKSNEDSVNKNKYRKRKVNLITVLEGALTLYFMIALFAGPLLGNMTMSAFHLLLVLGYGTIFFFSLKHSRA